MKNQVSIIIPVYNAEKYITETLNSILNQTHKSWECIIVDDGSIDNSKIIINEFIKKDTRFIFFERVKKLEKGANSCRNIGLSQAKGDFIQFFDADDIMLSNHLSTKVNVFKKEIETDLVVNKLSFFNNNERTYSSNIFSKNIFIDYYKGSIAYYICGPLWKHDFLKKIEAKFDINISNLDDWDFNIRMLLYNPNIKFLDTVSMLYRRYPNSLSKQINLCNTFEIKSEIYARNKIFNIFSKKNIELIEVNIFYKKRITELYRICLENNEYETAIFCYKNLKNHNLNYLENLKLIFAYVTYRIFGKGYIFLNNK